MVLAFLLHAKSCIILNFFVFEGRSFLFSHFDSKHSIIKIESCWESLLEGWEHLMNQFNLDMLQVLNNYDLKNLEV